MPAPAAAAPVEASLRRYLDVPPVLAALALGCVADPTAPELTATTSGSDIDSVYLSWTPPARGDFSGYTLEASSVPAVFRGIATFGDHVTSAPFYFDPGTPEQTDHAFRVRALPDPDGTRFSNEVIVRRGVRRPLLWCAAQYVHECRAGTPLLVENRSVVADHLVLGRTVVQFGDDWAARVHVSVATLQPWTTSWVDPDVSAWQDCAVLSYELRAVAPSSEGSEVALESTGTAPPRAPRAVSATAEAEGIRVTVENASWCATRLRVERRRVGDAAVVEIATVAAPAPPGIVSVYDLGIAPGEYEYTAYAEYWRSWLTGDQRSTGVSAVATF